jgi:hypothetical protein
MSNADCVSNKLLLELVRLYKIVSVHFSICRLSGGITDLQAHNMTKRRLIALKPENNGIQL